MRPPRESERMSTLRRDEAQLLHRYHRTRDPELREELVVMALPLVRAIAARYARRGEPVDDLVQVGSVGLLKAIDRFDPDRGVPFGAFATPNISGEIRRHFRDTTWSVRPPRELQELVLAVSKATEQLSTELGRPPRIDELAEATNVSPTRVMEALTAGEGYKPASLDAPVLEDGGTLGDTMGGMDGDYSMVDWRHDLRRGLAGLRPRERQIVALRFLGGLSQREIADRVGVSQMHVSRLLRGALAQMRETIGEMEVEVEEADGRELAVA
ncbi:MAG: SigB/SigF/SigG family RNA polymerase sigma factor [Solirubrobacteraceae bacterium]|nr:SigB/SigF/SigG family RNA polymerase sigma factor [Solirubrobacteraceae bacterium]